MPVSEQKHLEFFCYESGFDKKHKGKKCTSTGDHFVHMKGCSTVSKGETQFHSFMYCATLYTDG